jgi:hypothetical protein
MIADRAIEAALDELIQIARDIGPAVERSRKAEKMLGHIEALEMKKRNEASAAAQQREARASQPYKDALLEDALAAGELRKLMARKDVLEIMISVWQSQIKAQSGPRP